MDNEAIKVYGAKWCSDCFRAKMIPDNYLIKYQWIDIEHDENARAFVSRVNDGCIVVPTIHSMMDLYLSNQQTSNSGAS